MRCHPRCCCGYEDSAPGRRCALMGSVLERALRKDISFYSDEQSCVTLFHFLASQHMRTKGVKVKSIEILKRDHGLDISRIWAVMSHMFATNIGMTVFLERKRRKLILVENTTNLAFITGDQPLINLRGGGGKSPTELCWYYPISPCLALILTEVQEEPAFSTASLTSTRVSDLNALIAKASHKQVFAQSPTALQPFIHQAKT
ncbi:hypothetical protein CCR94_00085 [Rhodoblastus sphagnicola]|uniref:Uncharacterized protein n=3 Tax=Rhodoblastus sphagnicola TaxID=333368 RepID=A0A2S6NHL1_9HYPH|nr:hypothetical protein CCR94_00085 [Rhodoblastus sphagnicola]